MNPDKPLQSYNTSQESIKTCQKTQNNSDLAMMEKQFKYELSQCHELKNKLLKLFSSFDKEILKTIPATYTVRGGYEINRESFEGYVRRKAEQISKIFKEFEHHLNSPTKIIPKNDKISSPSSNQKTKIKIGKT
jgi:hypothetical protein